MSDPVRGQSSPGSPGIVGAIKDAVSAVATTFGPKSITQAPQREQAAEDAATGTPGSEDTRVPGNDVTP